MKECSLDDENIELIHVTKKEFLPSIKKRGLIPELSEFTKEAYINQHEDRFLDEEGELDWEMIDSELEELPDLVFAIEKEHLTPAIAMQESYLKGLKFKQLAVLGISSDCKEKFEKKTIASDEDYISTEEIPAGCLCEILDWKEHVDKSLLSFLIR